MMGPVAMTALTPQMPVPTAIKLPSRLGNPKKRVSWWTSAATMQTSTIGNACNPYIPAVDRLKREPSNMMPKRNNHFTQSPIPFS